MPLSRKDRKAIAQLRCGVAPHRIETGRWSKCNGRVLPANERVCIYCAKLGVLLAEDVEHFLLHCKQPDV